MVREMGEGGSSGMGDVVMVMVIVMVMVMVMVLVMMLVGVDSVVGRGERELQRC